MLSHYGEVEDSQRAVREALCMLFDEKAAVADLLVETMRTTERVSQATGVKRAPWGVDSFGDETSTGCLG